MRWLIGFISVVCVVAMVGTMVYLYQSSSFYMEKRQKLVYREMREGVFIRNVDWAVMYINENINKIGCSTDNISNVVHDYFSKVDQSGQGYTVDFYVSKSPSAWSNAEYRADFPKDSTNVLLCVQTHGGFSHDWLLMRSYLRWECGDHSIVDTNFVANSIKLEYSFPKGHDFGRSIVIDEYEYSGNVSRAEDD